jgi:hypothetical protein
MPEIRLQAEEDVNRDKLGKTVIPPSVYIEYE